MKDCMVGRYYAGRNVSHYACSVQKEQIHCPGVDYVGVVFWGVSAVSEPDISDVSYGLFGEACIEREISKEEFDKVFDAALRVIRDHCKE